MLIIGAGKTAELLAQAISSDVGMGYKIVGLLEDNKVQHGILDRYPVLGGFADAEKVIAQTGVKRVFIAAPGLPNSAFSGKHRCSSELCWYTDGRFGN